MRNSTPPVQLKIKEVFSSCRYSIPIYQRNYAWRESQITQLVQDVADCIGRQPCYYIGTLVVWERVKDMSEALKYDVIDGQQRLTTLALILCAIKGKNDVDADSLRWFKGINLSFESRHSSTEALSMLYLNPNKVFESGSGIEGDLTIGYKIAAKAIDVVLREKRIPLGDFVAYLIDNVYILRVPVPHDTDLNHYFEIMNSRGEQLEKHEILKAKLMSVFDSSTPEGKAKTHVFGMIWDACSDMDRYVQMGFEKPVREQVFGATWDSFAATSFEGVVKLMSSKENNDALIFESQKTLSRIVSDSKIPVSGHQGNVSEDVDSRFQSVINFQNFLLQVLRVSTQKDVAMDDKRLIDEFDERMKQEGVDTVRFVENFGFALLKCRFLFDRYVIKREYDERWAFQKIKVQGNNEGKKAYYVQTFYDGPDENENRAQYQKECEMLLAMFHVSHPTMIYKHWLNAVLNYLYYVNVEVEASSYKDFLEDLAERFLRRRFLAKTPVEYYELIYGNQLVSNNDDAEIDESLLDCGTSVENFIFNFLDYKLWKLNKSAYPTFEFTFRSSVEHYYPQHPMEGVPELARKVLDSFGNLCLISASRNSQLSNFTPKAKKDFYLKQTAVESIKQRIMLKAEFEPWDESAINKHGKEMRDILLGSANLPQ